MAQTKAHVYHGIAATDIGMSVTPESRMGPWWDMIESICNYVRIHQTWPSPDHPRYGAFMKSTKKQVRRRREGASFATQGPYPLNPERYNHLKSKGFPDTQLGTIASMPLLPKKEGPLHRVILAHRVGVPPQQEDLLNLQRRYNQGQLREETFLWLQQEYLGEPQLA